MKLKYFISFLFWIIVVSAFPQIDTLKNTVDTSATGVNDASNALLYTLGKKAINPKLAKDTVVLKFLKYKSEIQEGASYFNVLKIKNFTSEALIGELKIRVPEGWKLLSSAKSKVYVLPGDSAFVPFRASTPGNVKGGTAYLINAKIKTNKGVKYIGSCYVNLPKKTDFNLSVNQNVVYINSLSKIGTFKIKLSNSGNTSELIRLEFKMGGLLSVLGLEEETDYKYVELESGEDTIIKYNVYYHKLKQSELYLKNKLNESFLSIKALAGNIEHKESIWVKNIPYKFINERGEGKSPLTVGLFFNNMLASSPMRMTFNAYGGLYLKNNADLSYSLNIYNVGFDGKAYSTSQNFFKRNIFMNATYTTNRTTISLGDQRSGMGILGSIGRGLSVSHSFRKHNIMVGMLQNNYSPLTTVMARYSTQIWKLPAFSIGLAHLDDKTDNSSIRTLYFQSSLPKILKGHTLSYRLTLNNNIPGLNDTVHTAPVNGIMYTLSYNGRIKKLNMNANYRSNTKDYLLHRRIYTTFNSSANHNIGKYSKIYFRGYSRIYSFGNVNDTLRSYSNNERLNYTVRWSSRINSTLYYDIGPEYQQTISQNAIIGSSLKQDFRSYSERIYFRLSQSLGRGQSISPTIAAGVTTIKSSNILSDAPFGVSSTTKPKPNFNAGFNYNNRALSLSVSYIYGPFYTFNQFDVIATGKNTKRIRIMPTFQKTYVHPRTTIKFASYTNYQYSLPNQAQRINLNGRATFIFNGGWVGLINAAAYFSSFLNADGQQTSARNYSLNIGLRKSFNIDQPRVKFRNLKVIFFKDANGNGSREENEPLIPNILTHIERLKYEGINNYGYFEQKDLLSNKDGEIEYQKIPEGNYQLQLTPMVNLKNLYSINGNEQNFSISSTNLTIYVPYVESYKVFGRIIVKRAKFSSAGELDFSNIRVEATNSEGNTYSALTDKSGNYSINVPQAGYYYIKVRNVFGDNFTIEDDEYVIDFNGLKVYEVNFIFEEKARKINFAGGGDYKFDFGDYKDQKLFPDPEEVEDVPQKSTLNDEDIEAIRKLIEERVGKVGVERDLTKNDLDAIQRLMEDRLKNAIERRIKNDNSSKAIKQNGDDASSIKSKKKSKGTATKVSSDDMSKINQKKYSNRSLKKETRQSIDDYLKKTNQKFDPRKIKFRVQVGLFKETVPEDIYTKILPRGYTTQGHKMENGLVRYTSGNFSDYNQAVQHRNNLIIKGLPGPFVVGEYETVRLSAGEALELQKRNR